MFRVWWGWGGGSGTQSTSGGTGASSIVISISSLVWGWAPPEQTQGHPKSFKQSRWGQYTEGI